MMAWTEELVYLGHRASSFGSLQKRHMNAPPSMIQPILQVTHAITDSSIITSRTAGYHGLDALVPRALPRFENLTWIQASRPIRRVAYCCHERIRIFSTPSS